MLQPAAGQEKFMTDQHATILAFDSAVTGGSVALIHQNIRYEATLRDAESQASQLVSLIEDQLNAAGIWYDALTCAAVTIGPGSFTGTRIALAVARTLQFSFPDLPIHRFTTLECLASSHLHQPQNLHAILKAGKGEVYYQPFKQLQPLADIALLKPDLTLDDGIIIGNATELLPASLTPRCTTPILPTASAMLDALLAGYQPPTRALKPLYIRAPDAKISSKAHI